MTRTLRFETPTVTDHVMSKLVDKRLSWEWPASHHGDWGTEQPCAVCDQVIGAVHAEITADFGSGGPQAFHARCFVEWWRVVATGAAAVNEALPQEIRGRDPHGSRRGNRPHSRMGDP